MRKGNVSLLFIVIIAIAAIGLSYNLVNNPVGLITRLLVSVAIALVIGLVIYKLFIQKGSNSPEMKKYRKAAKYSQQRYKKNHQQISPKKKQRSRSFAKKRQNHLKVIEGSKANKDKKISN